MRSCFEVGHKLSKMHTLAAVFLLLVSTTIFAKESLEGHQVISLHPRTAEHVEMIQRLYRDASHKVDFWNEASRPGKQVTLRLHKRDAEEITEEALRKGMPSRILHNNLTLLLKRDYHEQVTKPEEQFHKAKGWRNFNFGIYHTQDEMEAFLHGITEEYSNMSRLVSFGKSLEGHPMTGIVIGGNGASGGNVTRRIFVDAGMHAREWAAPAVALYTINRLLNPQSEQDLRMRDEIEWHIIPLANPDGYRYSMADPENRYWRKNRSPQGCRDSNVDTCNCARNPDSCCFGVDPNRNWNFYWGFKGASNEPCSEIFKGPSTHSEPEVRNLANYMTSMLPDLHGYVSLHSYSDLWLIPYGYDNDAFPKDFDDMMELAREGVRAVNAVHGSNYSAEHSAGLYPAAGASDDWVKGVLGVKWVYTLELRPHEDSPEANADDGYGGFSLPKEQIIPTGEEIFEGLRVVANRIRQSI